MANEWNKTAFVEFETMLQRHLRSGAAPVAACAGFDLDAASAYLEGALGEWRLASYESHLAGCAICRRHLIELARLAQAAPSFEALPAAAPDRIPAWDRWKEAVAGWFDLSTWNLKWQIAGAAGAAFVILIAALGAQTWRHASNQADFAVSHTSATPPASSEPGNQPLQSPAPESLSQYATTVAGEEVAIRSSSSQALVPTPDVGLKENARDVLVPVPSELPALPESQPTAAPVPANKNRLAAAEQNPQRLSGRLEELAAVANAAPSGAETRQSRPPQPGPLVQINDLNRTSQSVFRNEPKEVAAAGTAQGPDVIPPFRADFVGSNSRPRPRQQPERPPRSKLRVLPEIKLWSLPDLWRRTFAPFSKSDSDTESERKAKPDKQEASDDGAPKPMQVMIRDKIFCYEKCKGPDLEKIRGMWIDREYDFEKQKWNVWTLKIGGEEYKRALAEEPLLKEFFDHGPILIVWKNRIYKVLK